MELVTIARRYAHALVAIDKNLEIKELLASLAELYKHPLVIALVNNAVVPKNHKSRIILELFATELPEYQQNFIKLLFEKQRFNCIKFIKREFNKLLALADKISYLKLEVAISDALPSEQVLQHQLQQVLHTQIELKVRRQSALLGGARITLNDQVIDGSLKSMFEALHAILLAH